MRKDFIAETTKVHEKVPNVKIIVLTERNHSEVKLYIPKKLVNGKKVPSVDPGARWYVYFYLTSLKTGERRKFIYKRGINRYKKISERKAYGRALIQALSELLDEGFNPFREEATFFDEHKRYSLKEALHEAYKNKSNEWKERTRKDAKFRMNNFLEWATDNNIDLYDVKDISKKHINAFLNYVATKNNNTSVNNYRTVLSTLFGKLANDDIIATNFIKDIPKRKQQATKNKPFTGYQVANIKQYLLKHDPYLYTYIKFMTYAFLRNIEVARLKVGDIDLKSGLIHVETKHKAGQQFGSLICCALPWRQWNLISMTRNTPCFRHP